MTIWILDNDPKKIAAYLSDYDLLATINEIAQVLCNVHWIKDAEYENKLSNLTFGQAIKIKLSVEGKVPLLSSDIDEFSLWATEALANYRYLVRLGMAAWLEHRWRFWRGKVQCPTIIPSVKKGSVILWCKNHEPDFDVWLIDINKPFIKTQAEGWRTPFPMPTPRLNEYSRVVEEYRSHYSFHLCHGEYRYTKRELPEWL